MGLMDYIKTQLIDIIEWTDDSRDTISWRFPDDDKEIKNGAQLIVRESQTAQFIYLGEFGDTFGPGKHTLTTDNIPVLTQPQGLEVRLRVAVQGRRLLRQHAAVHRQQVGHVEPDHDARPGLRHRAAARLRHLRLQGGRGEALPQGSGRLRPQLPPRRVRRHHALAHRQRLQRRHRQRQGAGARHRHALPGSGRSAAAAHQPGSSKRSTASRSRASSSRTARCRPRSRRPSTSARA